MSETQARPRPHLSPALGDTAWDAEVTPRQRPRRRRRALLAGTVIVALAAGSAAFAEWPRIQRLWQPPPPGPNAVTDNNAAVSTATVDRRDLTAQQQVSGALGYTGSYTVLGRTPGVVTGLPTIGQVISQGQAIYAVNTIPVELLTGSTPAYRDLALGAAGPDVSQLNADLVALGDATTAQINPASDEFGRATRDAVERLQAHLGVTQDGVLHLGQVVFLPTDLRVTTTPATVGGPATGPMVTGTTTTRQITVPLSATQQSAVHAGDAATITLPDNRTTAGTVTSVSTVATSASGSGGSGGSGSSAGSGSGSAPTVEVDITPTDPAATGSLDQAPVQVEITTGRVDNALVVPVTALLATIGGGYSVEVADGTHRLVPVTLGLFDDADGLVQITGTSLQPGEKVVVAGS